MVAPALLFGGGLAAGQLASTLFGKKGGGGPSFDPNVLAPLRERVKQGTAQQQVQIGALRPKLDELRDQFVAGTKGSLEQLTAEREARSARFLEDVSAGGGQIGQQLLKTLQEQAFAPVRAQQDLLREQLAGNISSGAAQRSLSQPILQAGAATSQGAQQIALARQQATQNAIQDVFSLDENFLRERGGIERDLLLRVFTSGTDAEKAEAAAILETLKQEQADLLAIDQFGLTGSLAFDASRRESAAASEAARLGAGSQLIGTILPFLLGQGGGGRGASPIGATPTQVPNFLRSNPSFNPGLNPLTI